jgi:hypothetical protein
MKNEIKTQDTRNTRVEIIITRLKNHKIIAVLIVLAIVLSGVAGVTDSITKITGFFSQLIKQPAEPFSLLNNGGFEDQFRHWGSGYVETEWFNGSMTPFWASYIGKPRSSREALVANVRGDLVSDIKRSGSYSLRIVNNQESKPHLYGTISQRVTGLEKNADYIARFWVKADRAAQGTLALTTDLGWVHRTSIPSGTYDWIQIEHKFKTEELTYIDFRFVSDQPGTVWIDDIRLDRKLE